MGDFEQWVSNKMVLPKVNKGSLFYVFFFFSRLTFSIIKNLKKQKDLQVALLKEHLKLILARPSALFNTVHYSTFPKLSIP